MSEKISAPNWKSEERRNHHLEALTVGRLTLLSLIQRAPLCCLSIMSLTLRYQLSVLSFMVMVALKTWFHTLSSFWHCSNSFFELLCADLHNSTINFRRNNLTVLTLASLGAAAWSRSWSRLWRTPQSGTSGRSWVSPRHWEWCPVERASRWRWRRESRTV